MSTTIASGHSTASRIGARQPVLTGAGVVVLSVFACLIGGLVDVLVADRLGACYAVCFIAASAYGAWRVRRSGLTTALLAPPLVFAGTSLVLLQLLPDAGGSGLVHEALRLAASLATQGPVVWIGTVTSAAILAYRWQQLRAQSGR
jgi:hypothetical protein